jgi:hypothetical protein
LLQSRNSCPSCLPGAIMVGSLDGNRGCLLRGTKRVWSATRCDCRANEERDRAKTAAVLRDAERPDLLAALLRSTRTCRGIGITRRTSGGQRPTSGGRGTGCAGSSHHDVLPAHRGCATTDDVCPHDRSWQRVSNSSPVETTASSNGPELSASGVQTLRKHLSTDLDYSSRDMSRQRIGFCEWSSKRLN